MPSCDNFTTMFSLSFRPLCVGITHSIASAFGAINVKTYPYQLETLQFYGTFYLYAGANFLTLLVAALTIPDNRGLSLVKVEQNYENGKKNKDVDAEITKSLMQDKV